MFNYLKYRHQLRILTNKQKKTSKFYSKEIEQAREQKKCPDEIEQLRSEDLTEYLWTQEEIDLLITNYLRNKANTLFVPLPEHDDEEMWEKCHMSSQKKC